MNVLLNNLKKAKKRKRGRPKKKDSEKMSSIYFHSLYVKISENQRHTLDQLALNIGCSAATVIRQLIEKAGDDLDAN